MKKLKKPLLIVVVLLVILFAIPVIVLLGVDVNPYKEDLAELVKQQTGRSLKIEGNIKKTIVPWFGISIGKLSVGNPEDFGESDFAKIDKFSLKVKFWALFSGRVEIDSVQLDKLELHLLQIPGKNNWTFSTASSDEPAANSAEKQTNKDAAPADAAVESASGFSLDDISLAGVKINDANISFEDQINKLNFAANNLNVNLSHFKFGSPAKLTLSLTAVSQSPAMNAKINLDSTVNIDPDDKRYGGEVKSLTVTLKSDLVGKEPLKVKLTSEANFDAGKGLLHVPSLTVSSNELNLGLSAEQIQATPAGFKGNIAISEMNLRTYLARLGIAMPEGMSAKALNRFSLNTRYLFDLDHANLRELKLRLDNSELSGAISHIQFSPFGVQWKLALDQFNLDDYFPPPPPSDNKTTGDEKVAVKPSSADNGDAELLPLDLLSKLELDGELKIKKLQARNIVIEQSDIVVKNSGSGAQVKLNIQSIANGSLQTALQMKTDKSTPNIQSTIKMSKVSIAEILQKLLDTDMVSGAKVDLDSQLDSRGNSLNAWKRGLNGKVNLELNEGAFNGINVMSGLIQKYEKYIKRDFPKGEIENRTVFDQVSTSMVAKNGIFTSTKLIARSPEMTANGKAMIDLPGEKLDVTLNLKGEKFPKFISAADVKNLSGVTFPFTVKGPFSAPVIDYDVAGPLKGLAKTLVKKKIEQKKEEAKTKINKSIDTKVDQKKEEIKDKLKDRFKKLF